MVRHGTYGHDGQGFESLASAEHKPAEHGSGDAGPDEHEPDEHEARADPSDDVVHCFQDQGRLIELPP